MCNHKSITFFPEMLLSMNSFQKLAYHDLLGKKQTGFLILTGDLDHKLYHLSF